MNFDTPTLVNLLTEQNLKKVEFDKHLQFDLLGINKSPDEIMKHYDELKILAVRIIEIENILDRWAMLTYLPLEGCIERIINN